ncbi:MAG: SDR family NAD(P)-dependent oxidoreductase [Akkermansia sp.]|nr:SDR family NAD(P)-dependent oxidoreductase [Akkermansia sp.]
MAFARRLVGECAHMVLVARRQDVLHELADELRSANSTLKVTVKACDLASLPARAALIEELQSLPEGKTLLINNAGLGDYGEYMSSTPERNNQMLQVNVLAVAELTRAVLPRLLTQGGGIINIASLAADLFIPDFAIYAASKAFVASFSEAIRLEVKKAGVPVVAVCPGPVHTGFGDVARRHGCSNGYSSFKKWIYTSIPTVVNGALDALARNKPRYYPSRRIRLAGWLLRNTPLWLMRAVMGSRPRKVEAIEEK